jgi:hypothetical protein
MVGAAMPGVAQLRFQECLRIDLDFVGIDAGGGGDRACDDLALRGTD